MIFCPLRCFCPSRSAVISDTDSANRNCFSVPKAFPSVPKAFPRLFPRTATDSFETKSRPPRCLSSTGSKTLGNDQLFGRTLEDFCRTYLTGSNPGDTKIISVCRVSKAHDGGARGGTESQVFRGCAAAKRMRTRSHRDNANESPPPRCFFTSEGIVNLPQSVFLGLMLLRRWQ